MVWDGFGMVYDCFTHMNLTGGITHKNDPRGKACIIPYLGREGEVPQQFPGAFVRGGVQRLTIRLGQRLQGLRDAETVEEVVSMGIPRS